ncbi:MAG: BON domain-containing protein [Verrucomicrobiota bacterium]|nr:BON domain-containing protein [Verrucomicrobiota bacterium]
MKKESVIIAALMMTGGVVQADHHKENSSGERGSHQSEIHGDSSMMQENMKQTTHPEAASLRTDWTSPTERGTHHQAQMAKLRAEMERNPDIARDTWGRPLHHFPGQDHLASGSSAEMQTESRVYYDEHDDRLAGSVETEMDVESPSATVPTSTQHDPAHVSTEFNAGNNVQTRIEGTSESDVMDSDAASVSGQLNTSTQEADSTFESGRNSDSTVSSGNKSSAEISGSNQGFDYERRSKTDQANNNAHGLNQGATTPPDYSAGGTLHGAPAPIDNEASGASGGAQSGSSSSQTEPNSNGSDINGTTEILESQEQTEVAPADSSVRGGSVESRSAVTQRSSAENPVLSGSDKSSTYQADSSIRGGSREARGSSDAIGTAAGSESRSATNNTDRELTRKVQSQLSRDTSGVHGPLASEVRNIEVTANQGKVTLKGSVRSEQDKNIVETRVREVQGVSSVDNQLTISSKDQQSK